jgi:hypothetical protein
LLCFAKQPAEQMLALPPENAELHFRIGNLRRQKHGLSLCQEQHSVTTICGVIEALRGPHRLAQSRNLRLSRWLAHYPVRPF